MEYKDATVAHGKSNEIPKGLLVGAILLVGLLPIHAYYYAFTRSTPLWLEWSIVSLLSAGGFYLIVACLREWRTTSIARRWFSLLLAVSFVTCLDGSFLFTRWLFMDELGDCCFGFCVFYKIGDFFIQRVERKRPQTVMSIDYESEKHLR